MTVRALPKFMVLLALVCAGVLAVSLRRDEEGIRSYTVQRPEPSSRLLGAIIPQGDKAVLAKDGAPGKAWFFKLTGPNQAVAEQAPAFRQLIESVTFPSEGNSEPTWTLPEGWTQRPGSQMRFATLQVEAGGDTECSVTVLPITNTDWNAYLLANINRWRDQLRVPKISERELAASTSELKLRSGDATATLVEFAGELSLTNMAPPALASTTSDRPPMPGAAKPATQENLTYDVPKGWTPGALEVSRGGVTVRRAAVFEVRDGDQRVEVTVTKLPASAMLGNVNRWRGQIGLESITNQQFDEVKKQLEFAGRPADYVQFVGEKEAILGVIAVLGPEAWFVKLQGSADLAAREKEHFEAFVKSIRM
jgi:hypothetical protein